MLQALTDLYPACSNTMALLTARALARASQVLKVVAANAFLLSSEVAIGSETGLSAACHSNHSRPRSNGQTEGQIARIKLIKRQMYGRDKLDLLRARVLQAA
jgi:hypothetical protein